MDFDISSDRDFYYLPTGIDEDLVKIIKSQMVDSQLEESTIYHPDGEMKSDDKIRKSKVSWIATDNWISGIMFNLINIANVNFYNFDLTQWADKVQYTVYDEKNSHYSWHQDTAISPFNNSICRKLSISLLLSDPDEYEGGELQLLYGGNRVVTLKPELGDAVVFPSSIRHRVRKVRSGKRESLVGWYGGPFWK